MSRRAGREFDLAPRRQRPLSLWNPLDYLVLLYWVFFFPQALHWYVKKFGRVTYRDARGRAVWRALRDDPVQRRLVIQAVLLLLGAAAIALWGLPQFDIPVAWLDLIIGIAAGVVTGVAFGMTAGSSRGGAGGLAEGMARIVFGGRAMRVVVSVGFGVTATMALGIAVGATVGVAGGTAVGMATGVAIGVAFSAAIGLVGGVAGGVAIGMAASVAVGVVIGVAGNVSEGFAFDLAGGMAGGMAVLLMSLDVLGWMLSLFIRGGKKVGPLSRRTWLPIPGLRNALVQRLTGDWEAGVAASYQLLAYSSQVISVVAAVSRILTRSSPDVLLERVATLARDSQGWDLLSFCTANLNHALRKRAVRLFVFIPKTWRQAWAARYLSAPRLDTPARSACAGFWAWHNKDAVAAVEAFQHVRDVRFGQELASIAEALQHGLSGDTLDLLIDWHVRTAWLDTLPEERLRPGTIAVLSTLRSAAAEVAAAQTAHAPLNRTAALGRAAAQLQDLINYGGATCPQPEWPMIRDIAESWRDLVVKAGGVAGEEVTRQRVLNPYFGYSGLPVQPPAFVGRAGAMREVQRHWAGAEDPPVIVLYGHRRMGKTSILLNLQASLPAGSLLTYLDAQGIVADNSGQFLLDVAEAIHKRVTKAGLDAGPQPVEADYDRLGRARRRLNELLEHLAPQMTESRRLILAFDEFELIQDYIRDGRIDAAVLGYFRSINQSHRWLALIFGGLHTMDEMGTDYQSAFYAQTQHVRVSYLARTDALHLITQPHPDFALEYHGALCDELMRLTHGQPFLLQRLCWTMVERWNDRFVSERGTLPRILTLDDLAPVLDDELFSVAAYYFEGVWKNISPSEQSLMTVLATRETPWDIDALAAAATCSAGELTATLTALRHHDVIIDTPDGRIGYASDLLRQWVVRHTASHRQ